VTFRVENPHGKSSGTPSHGLADGAETDDAQGFAVYFTSEKMDRLAAGEEAGSQRAIRFHDSARHREQERPMKIRGCLGHERRISGDGNAPSGRRRNVDPGGRGCHRGDQLKIRARVDHLRVHRVMEQA